MANKTNLKQTTLRVEGMHCKSCGMLITDALEELGVESVEVLEQEGLVKVTFDQTKLSLRQITKTIEKEGYKIK